MSPGCPCPHVPWLLVPLLVAAGAAAAKRQQVNGVLGGSVLLSPVLPPNQTVTKIQWSFSAGAGPTIEIAEFSPAGFKRPNPNDRFRDRLEVSEDTGLRIGALERGDSGVYGVRIKLRPALVEDQTFSLSVYGPVPAPEIQPEGLSLSSRGCNVTLRCRVPNGSDAEAAWQPGAPWGRLCRDNRTLCLAAPHDAFDTAYTCTARNPGQERSVSVLLGTLCRPQGPRRWQRWHTCPGLLVGAVGGALGIVWLRRRKRRKKAAGGAAPPASEDAPAEPLYAEIQTPSPGAGDRQWDPPHHPQPGAGRRAELLA